MSGRKVCVNKTMILDQAKPIYLTGWTKLGPQAEPMVMVFISPDRVCGAVEVMHDGATHMTQNKRTHGDENHLNRGGHCPYDAAAQMLRRDRGHSN